MERPCYSGILFGVYYDGSSPVQQAFVFVVVCLKSLMTVRPDLDIPNVLCIHPMGELRLITHDETHSPRFRLRLADSIPSIFLLYFIVTRPFAYLFIYIFLITHNCRANRPCRPQLCLGLCAPIAGEPPQPSIPGKNMRKQYDPLAYIPA